jgi:NADH:quinone reductase (non-electrogenic)
MKDVIVIGGGFAGLTAVRQLSRYKKYIRVTLIDEKTTFDFLPCLPDILSSKIHPKHLTNNFSNICHEYGGLFVNETVTNIDFKTKTIFTNVSEILFDYVLVASGSRTNFYGDEKIKKHAYALDNIDNAIKLKGILDSENITTVAIVGGGYTGVEVATHIRYLFKNQAKEKRIVILERGPSLLAPAPDWMKQYVRSNLIKLDIEVKLASTVNKMGASSIWLSSGEIFNDAVLIWCAGVAASDFSFRLDAARDKQGRIAVDRYLRCNDFCFVAGDAASFSCKQGPLRMAVQFSINQGKHAALNILRSIVKLPLKKYRPFDLGWVVPMANNHGCGKVLNVSVKGVVPVILHYFFSIMRALSLKNKVGILRGLLKGGGNG